MKFYRSLSLYRRVQVFALAMLLSFQIGGFLLVIGSGGTINELLAGLGIEMVGAVFTAVAVAYIDKSFTMAFERKFGDPISEKLDAIEKTLARLEEKIDD